MAKGKSVNLTPREKKKQDKYSEINPTKQEYRFKPTDKVFYVGLLDEYSGQECEIVKRSRRKITEFYVIKFNDEEIVTDISGNFLMTPEEYEDYLFEQENDSEESAKNDLSEYEIELNKQGIESHKNYVQCLVPTLYYTHNCTECTEEKKCVYRNKYKYGKIKFN